MPAIMLQGVDTEALGLAIESGAPFLGGHTLTRESQSWPGRAGVVSASRGTTDPTIIRFTTIANPADPASRQSLLDSYADLLAGPIEITYVDSIARAIQGWCRVYDPAPAGSPTFASADTRITVEIQCDSAARYDVEPLSRVVGAAPVEIPAGTFPHWGEFVMRGALSGECRIRYRGITGTILGELVLGLALGADETLTGSFQLRSLLRTTTAGVTTDVYETWKTGGAWFAFDRQHADPAADAWGTLECTLGTMLVRWRRHWKN
jgi:hypothetical protein